MKPACSAGSVSSGYFFVTFVFLKFKPFRFYFKFCVTLCYFHSLKVQALLSRFYFKFCVNLVYSNPFVAGFCKCEKSCKLLSWFFPKHQFTSLHEKLLLKVKIFAGWLVQRGRVLRDLARVKLNRALTSEGSGK